jgi:hypothetical protein
METGSLVIKKKSNTTAFQLIAGGSLTEIKRPASHLVIRSTYKEYLVYEYRQLSEGSKERMCKHYYLYMQWVHAQLFVKQLTVCYNRHMVADTSVIILIPQ